MKIQLEWKLADCWIGVFWKRDKHTLHIWVCIVPCLPLHAQVLISNATKTGHPANCVETEERQAKWDSFYLKSSTTN